MEKETAMKTSILPTIALRGLTVFPNMLIHFDVGRESSIKALEEAMSTGVPVFLVAQRDISVERPGAEDLYQVGTISNVRQLLRMPGDNVRVMVEGVCRARLIAMTRRNPYLETEVQEIPAEYVEHFSLILCNPPYERGGFSAADEKKAPCKRELALTLPELAASAARCLKYGGRFALVERADRLAETVCALHERGLEPKKLQFIAGKEGDAPYAFLLAAKKGGKAGMEILPALVNGRNP